MSKARLKLLKREVKELRRAQGLISCCAMGGGRPANRGAPDGSHGAGRGSARQDDDHHGQQPQGTVSIG
nr:hypothetical protein [Novosphingobium sp. UBA1939]